MRRKDLVVLVIGDCLIVTTVCALYITGVFAGANRGWLVAAISLPMLLNLIFISERSSIRFLAPQELPSIFPNQLPHEQVPATFQVKDSPKEEPHGPAKLAAASAIALILLFAIVAGFTKKIPLSELSMIVLLGISVTFNGFSLTGNFWKPSWADADPGINVMRCLIVGILCVTAFMDLLWGLRAWFGALEYDMNRDFLKLISGLAIVGYYGRRMRIRSIS